MFNYLNEIILLNSIFYAWLNLAIEFLYMHIFIKTYKILFFIN